MTIEPEYKSFLEEIKQRVASSRYRAALSVNKELILSYHHIGRQILLAQHKHSWGSKVIDNLSKDLKSAFPDMKGFSHQNLKYMRKFASEYTNEEISQQLVDQLPWGHITVLLYRLDSKEERGFYICQIINNTWSRKKLQDQIGKSLHLRQAKAVTNFDLKLPSPQSDLAKNTLKDPYSFDFLGLGKDANEREIEKALVDHVEKFLLELGEGFAFMGRQYHLKISDNNYFLDLLFYHVKLRCYVVVELKNTAFKPEYAGKLNFYLSAVDDLLRHPDDKPSIGLILCRSKDNVLAEYALRDMTKPIGLADYSLTKILPENLKTALPTIEEIEEEMDEIAKKEGKDDR